MYDELSIKRLRKINGSFGGDVTERIPFYDLLLSYYIDNNKWHLYSALPHDSRLKALVVKGNVLNVSFTYENAG